ncbi:MAG TPA: hypothetical protein VIK56_05540 [Rhodoferax sp.]
MQPKAQAKKCPLTRAFSVQVVKNYFVAAAFSSLAFLAAAAFSALAALAAAAFSALAALAAAAFSALAALAAAAFSALVFTLAADAAAAAGAAAAAAAGAAAAAAAGAAALAAAVAGASAANAPAAKRPATKAAISLFIFNFLEITLCQMIPSQTLGGLSVTGSTWIRLTEDSNFLGLKFIDAFKLARKRHSRVVSASICSQIQPINGEVATCTSTSRFPQKARKLPLTPTCH